MVKTLKTCTLRGLYENDRLVRKYQSGDVYVDTYNEFNIIIYCEPMGNGIAGYMNASTKKELRQLLKKYCRPFTTINKGKKNARPMLEAITVYYDDIGRIHKFSVDEEMKEKIEKKIATSLKRREKAMKKVAMEHYGALESFGIF